MSRYYCETVTRYQVIDGETGRVVGSYVTEEMAKEVRSALNEKEIADEHFAGKASSQDTDSTETVESSHDPVEFGSDEPEAVEPMADLSGVEIQPLADQTSQAFNYYQPNGSLPETE